MLRRLRHLLSTAQNSVVVGFTGTPLCDEPSESVSLKDIIKGPATSLTDEGFLSYYMDTPRSVFPRVCPAGVPAAVPEVMLRTVALRNLPPPSRDPDDPYFFGYSRRRAARGNRVEYQKKMDAETLSALYGRIPLTQLKQDALSRLSKWCAISQAFTYVGQEKVAKVVHGEAGNLLSVGFPHVPMSSRPQRRRAAGYCSKLQAIVEDVARALPADGDAANGRCRKTLVMVHRMVGYKLLLRMMAAKLGDQRVRGFPPARTWSERNDPTLAPLLGVPHNETLPRGKCQCVVRAASASLVWRVTP